MMVDDVQVGKEYILKESITEHRVEVLEKPRQIQGGVNAGSRYPAISDGFQYVCLVRYLDSPGKRPNRSVPVEDLEELPRTAPAPD